MAETKKQGNENDIVKALATLREENNLPAVVKRLRELRKRVDAVNVFVRAIEQEERERILAEEESLREERRLIEETEAAARAAEAEAEAVRLSAEAEAAQSEQPLDVQPEEVSAPERPQIIDEPSAPAPVPELEQPEEKPLAIEAAPAHEAAVEAAPAPEAVQPAQVAETKPAPAPEQKRPAAAAPEQKKPAAAAPASEAKPAERPSWQGTPRPELAKRLDRRDKPAERPAWQGAPRPDAVARRAAELRQNERPAWQGAPRPDARSGAGGASGAPRPIRPPRLTPGEIAVPQSALSGKKPDKDKKEVKHDSAQKQINKRTLIRRGFVIDDANEDRNVYRKARTKKKDAVKEAQQKIEFAVITTENLTVKILSEKIGITAQEIIKQLMLLGIMTTINTVVDFPTMELVADALGVKIELKLDKTKEEQLFEFHDETAPSGSTITRPPIVTVMGHVDHGKTSLLDRIKESKVAEGEAGGITQHIGAYTVSLDGKFITFIDTPGHEAFTAMRARGAKVTDVAIIVVAADDGIMPQTIEAINHARAAGVPIVIAANKIDKPNVNLERLKSQLTEHNVLIEEWGGDVPIELVSAKTGAGIEKLLRSVLAVAEVADLSADPERKARGTIIEARLDKGKGAIATLIVQNGTLHVGDTVVSGFSYGRIRAMFDDKNKQVKEAGPSYAVSVVGFQEVPAAGEPFYVVEDDKLARQVAQERENKQREALITSFAMPDFDELVSRTEKVKEINLIVKADVQGSVEALKSSIAKLATGEVKINIIHSAVGAISQSDINLAVTAKATILGFNIRPDNEIKTLAEKNNIQIRMYRIIYEALEDIEKWRDGLIEPVYEDKTVGHAEVRVVYRISGVGAIAGCYVRDGKILRNAKVRVLRNSAIIYDSTVESLKRFKDDAKEVAAGFECGIGVANYNDLKEGDILEVYVSEEVKQ